MGAMQPAQVWGYPSWHCPAPALDAGHTVSFKVLSLAEEVRGGKLHH